MNFKSFSEIEDICKKYGIEGYSIRNNGLVDVDGSVDLRGEGFWDMFGNHEKYGKRHKYILEEIPIKFGDVEGDFDCRYNNIKNLNGAPKFVGGNLYISDNKLSSFKGCPTEVSRFLGGDNLVKSLEGCPRIVEGDFNVSDCPNLKSLKGGPEMVGGYYGFSESPVYDVSGFPEDYLDPSFYMEDDDKNIFFGNTPFCEILSFFLNCVSCGTLENCSHSKDNRMISKIINHINRNKSIDGNKVYINKLRQIYNELKEEFDEYGESDGRVNLRDELTQEIEFKNYIVI